MFSEMTFQTFCRVVKAEIRESSRLDYVLMRVVVDRPKMKRREKAERIQEFFSVVSFEKPHVHDLESGRLQPGSYICIDGHIEQSQRTRPDGSFEQRNDFIVDFIRFLDRPRSKSQPEEEKSSEMA
ncbi:single-stranded DNA-binding protein [Aestuariispira insulae]|uniref:Single-stranded DNA-binding protein n=1 Tax=Aestuariispira insulae TaxID=1461337 RepID=A0A3D9H3P9_9PROT|nr:single-stranded DNA-binding protein [Aestuariispira insulae]RED44110.1 single-stranded DNA-binding protein [Aestuariispira insulae]